MKLVGEKVYLEMSRVENAETYVKWIYDPDILRFTTIVPMDLEAETEYIKSRNPETDEVWSIYLKENDKLIGNVGAHKLDNPDKNFGIGIIIGEKDEWWKGYATDAFDVLIKYLFEEKGAKKLNLTVYPDNAAARAIYKKVGFKEIRHEKQPNKREGTEDEVIYMELEPS